jgi:hypothetical protein
MFIKALLAFKLILLVILASFKINFNISLNIFILAIFLTNSLYFLNAIALNKLNKPLNIKLIIISLSNLYFNSFKYNIKLYI